MWPSTSPYRSKHAILPAFAQDWHHGISRTLTSHAHPSILHMLHSWHVIQNSLHEAAIQRPVRHGTSSQQARHSKSEISPQHPSYYIKIHLRKTHHSAPLFCTIISSSASPTTPHTALLHFLPLVAVASPTHGAAQSPNNHRIYAEMMM